MPQPRDGLLHHPGYPSWKKLQLSRAKLKASSKTSALLSGFAMVAMVEMQFNQSPQKNAQSNTTGSTSESTQESVQSVPGSILVVFAICTTLLVAVHMLAVMISTCILPNIEAVCNLNSIDLVHESPHERLHWYIEIAWTFSTLIGLLLFLFEIAILSWVKFYDVEYAAWASCAILIPVVIIFLVFAMHFYKTLVLHKYEVSVNDIEELESLTEEIQRRDSARSKKRISRSQLGSIHVV